MINLGQQVGNYRVTASLGEGGMGTVFLAEHPVIGRKVALKAIHPRYARNAEVISRFVTEAQAVNQIGHDHIVDITDFGTTPNGDFYFMMECLEGECLADAIKAAAPFPPARALNIAAQIADALNASHEHGVVHRDLKPENIFLIARDGLRDFVKVLDFGLAKLTHGDDSVTRHSRVGCVMGTPHYMSPEQCEGKADVDHRADVYALGVILFEMLTGKIPFGGAACGEILIKQVTLQPPSARSIVPDLPPAMDLILFRALAKDPRQRFSTMAELREALLDPERYASSAAGPTAGVQDALSGHGGDANPQRRADAGAGPSTFRDGVGEVWVRQDDAIPRAHGPRNALFVTVAVAGLSICGMRYGREARGFVAAAVAPRGPAPVRVTFDSDPEGASVVRADGVVLGTTPLSTSLPFGDAAIEYVIRRDAYLSQTTSIVPNVASEVFATLQRDDPGPPSDPASLAAGSANESPPATAPSPALATRLPPSRRAARHPSSAPRLDADSDDVLDPSFR